MEAIEENQWKSLTGRFLGKPQLGKWHKLMMDIKCVDCGLKPALLLDFAVPQISSLCDFVEALQGSNLIRSQNIKIINIGMDVLLVNYKESVTTDMGNDMFHRRCFVDISSDLDEPRIISSDSCCLEPTEACLSMLLRELQSDRKSISLSLDSMTDQFPNPSTLFGIFLDYPVVYWYKMSEESQENCLSMVSLKAYIVKGSLNPLEHSVTGTVNSTSECMHNGVKRERMCKDGDRNNRSQTHDIYSFSVPEVMDPPIFDKVLSWFDVKRCQNGRQQLFTDLRLECKTVQLPSVCL